MKEYPAGHEYRYGLARRTQHPGHAAACGGRPEREGGGAAPGGGVASTLHGERPVILSHTPRWDARESGRDPHWTNRHAEAEAAQSPGLALSERLVADFPEVPKYHETLSIGLEQPSCGLSRARIRRSRGLRPPVLASQRAVAERYPDVPTYAIPAAEQLCGPWSGLPYFERRQLPGGQTGSRAWPPPGGGVAAAEPPRSPAAQARLANTLCLSSRPRHARRSARRSGPRTSGHARGWDSPGMSSLTHLRTLMRRSSRPPRRRSRNGRISKRESQGTCKPATSGSSRSSRSRSSGTDPPCSSSGSRMRSAWRRKDSVIPHTASVRQKGSRAEAGGRYTRGRWWALYRVGDWKGCSRPSESPRILRTAISSRRWRTGGWETRPRPATCFDRADSGFGRARGAWNQAAYHLPSMLRRIRSEAAALLGRQPVSREVRSEDAYPGRRSPPE